MTSPLDLPAALADALRGYAWTRAAEGESGGVVFRLDAVNRQSLYVKQGVGTVADDIAAEHARLQWLAPHVLVPTVRYFEQRDATCTLVATALDGRSAYEELLAQPAQRPMVVAQIARFLRRLHETPIAGCPFQSEASIRLREARGRIDAGLVDTSDFDDEREGWTATAVCDSITAMLPLPFERVLTHGDFSLGNILVANGRVTGCIDVGRAGVADPYQDLALLWNNLREFDETLAARFWKAYGIMMPDERRLAFHLGLDELF